MIKLEFKKQTGNYKCPFAPRSPEWQGSDYCSQAAQCGPACRNAPPPRSLGPVSQPRAPSLYFWDPWTRSAPVSSGLLLLAHKTSAETLPPPKGLPDYSAHSGHPAMLCHVLGDCLLLQHTPAHINTKAPSEDLLSNWTRRPWSCPQESNHAG